MFVVMRIIWSIVILNARQAPRAIITLAVLMATAPEAPGQNVLIAAPADAHVMPLAIHRINYCS